MNDKSKRNELLTTLTDIDELIEKSQIIFIINHHLSEKL